MENQHFALTFCLYNILMVKHTIHFKPQCVSQECHLIPNTLNTKSYLKKTGQFYFLTIRCELISFIHRVPLGASTVLLVSINCTILCFQKVHCRNSKSRSGLLSWASPFQFCLNMYHTQLHIIFPAAADIGPEFLSLSCFYLFLTITANVAAPRHHRHYYHCNSHHDQHRHFYRHRHHNHNHYHTLTVTVTEGKKITE